MILAVGLVISASLTFAFLATPLWITAVAIWMFRGDVIDHGAQGVPAARGL